MCHSEEESIFLNNISFRHAPATVYTFIEFLKKKIFCIFSFLLFVVQAMLILCPWWILFTGSLAVPPLSPPTPLMP